MKKLENIIFSLSFIERIIFIASLNFGGKITCSLIIKAKSFEVGVGEKRQEFDVRRSRTTLLFFFY